MECRTLNYGSSLLLGLALLYALPPAVTASETTPAGIPRAEAACVQDSGDPKTPPKTVYADCGAAVNLFRSMTKTASKADADVIATDIALFEIYQAHAADAIPGNSRGDALRSDAKRIWLLLAERSTDKGVRDHARASLQCFFENNGASCQKAFSASPSSF